jgi:hypothetical protein
MCVCVRARECVCAYVCVYACVCMYLCAGQKKKTQDLLPFPQGGSKRALLLQERLFLGGDGRVGGNEREGGGGQRGAAGGLMLRGSAAAAGLGVGCVRAAEARQALPSSE